MAIITYGKIDKKLIIIIFIVICSFINVIAKNEAKKEYYNKILDSLEEDIGPILTGIIAYFTFKNKQKEEEKDRKNFKYIIYLFLLRGVKSSYHILYHYFIEEEYDYLNILLNTINGVEIILMSFGTFLFLKYKYYVHHYITMFIYCLLGIINDLIMKNYSILNYEYIYILIIFIVNEKF